MEINLDNMVQTIKKFVGQFMDFRNNNCEYVFFFEKNGFLISILNEAKFKKIEVNKISYSCPQPYLMLEQLLSLLKSKVYKKN